MRIGVIVRKKLVFRKWDQYKINGLGCVCEGLVIKMDQ